MTHAASNADVCVLLTPRAVGGHETALFAWLADAVRDAGLRPLIVAPDAALSRACARAGLAEHCLPLRPASHARAAHRQALDALRNWPAHKPLLLAPGVLHAGAWLTAAAQLLDRRVWLYVPMAFTARQMQYRLGALRDRLLAPWLRGVDAFITLDQRQADLLRSEWAVTAPVHLLPNPLRAVPAALALPRPAADGRLRVAYVGRFEAHQKGLDWVIDVLRTGAPWTRQCQWRFQGQGPAGAALRALARDLGAARVLVNDHAPIEAALARSDVLLLCSRFEGVPLVALEATARGWPVVASTASGVANFLPARSVFEFGDAEGLRRALQSLRTPLARRAAVAHARAALDAMDVQAVYERSLVQIARQLRAPGQPAPSRAPAAAL